MKNKTNLDVFFNWLENQINNENNKEKLIRKILVHYHDKTNSYFLLPYFSNLKDKVSIKIKKYEITLKDKNLASATLSFDINNNSINLELVPINGQISKSLTSLNIGEFIDDITCF